LQSSLFILRYQSSYSVMVLSPANKSLTNVTLVSSHFLGAK